MAYKGVIKPVEGTILTVIRDAADMAAIAGYTEITGYLRITSDLTDLDGLSSLTTVGGMLMPSAASRIVTVSQSSKTIVWSAILADPPSCSTRTRASRSRSTNAPLRWDNLTSTGAPPSPSTSATVTSLPWALPGSTDVRMRLRNFDTSSERAACS